MSECETCGGLGFTQDGDKREQCVCVSRRRAEVYLRKAQPLCPVPEYQKHLDGAEKRGVLLQVPETFSSPRQAKWVFAYLLLKGGIRRTYEILNAYELVDIYFREHVKFGSVHRLTQDVLCLYYGFHEFKNTRQGELICQTLSLRDAKGLSNLVMVRGNPEFGTLLESYAEDNGYQTIQLPPPGKATGKATKEKDKRTRATLNA